MVERINEASGKTMTCFFGAAIGHGGRRGARLMSVKLTDDNGCRWFLTAKDSRSNSEIAEQAEVRLFF